MIVLRATASTREYPAIHDVRNDSRKSNTKKKQGDDFSFGFASDVYYYVLRDAAAMSRNKTAVKCSVMQEKPKTEQDSALQTKTSRY